MRIQLRVSALVLSLITIIVAAIISFRYVQSTPVIAADAVAEFVGRDQCIQCHAKEHQSWEGSHHDRAMDHATAKTVLADFNNTSFRSTGGEVRFQTRDGKYYAETIGVDGKSSAWPVKYTFGFEPLQQYLVELPDGRLQALTVAWDTSKRKWFDLYPDEELAPGDPLHWTGRGMNWQTMCADCHSTGVALEYNAAENQYKSTWSEIDVSCESCHGAGSLHLEIVKRRWWGWDPKHGKGLAQLKGTASDIQIDTCGRCHVRAGITKLGFKPGDDLLDYVQPVLLDGEAYYPDGQIRDEDFDYTSFHLSRMYHKGVRCTDCHDPHSARLLAEGNALCCRCHNPGQFDTPTHHFHTPGKSGAQCVDCHMPSTTYMQVDPRRDHSFSIPRPERTISLGIPNACNRCHSDKPAEWSVDAVTKWYGRHEHPARRNFAEAIAGGRLRKPEARDPLIALLRHEEIPAFVKASALSLLGAYESSSVDEAILHSLIDPSDLVRAEAVRGLGERVYQRDPLRGQMFFDERRARRVIEAMEDESPLVRQSAALASLNFSADIFSEAQQEAKDKLIDDYLATQRQLVDRPEHCLNLGNYHLTRAEYEPAESWFQQALLLDKSSMDARLRLAIVYDATERLDEACQVLREAVVWSEKIPPRSDDITRRAYRLSESNVRYHLGLILARFPNRQTEAIDELCKSANIEPTRHRAWYNLGLLYEAQQNLPLAEDALRRAVEQSPTSEEYAYALAFHYLKRGDKERAARVAESILRQWPSHPGAQQILAQIARLP